MKKLKLFLVVIILMIITMLPNLSCDPGADNSPCSSGKGTLELTNNSLLTVQTIMINGVSYGTLDPGKEKSIDLSPGVYTWQLVGLAGGTGCSAATVTITECDTQAFKCSAK
jgi:hypothetical protein